MEFYFVFQVEHAIMSRRFKSELRRSQLRRRKRSNVIDIDRHVHLYFGKWLKERVEKNEINNISDDIRCLAQGLSEKVLKFSAFNINGFKFRTIERDQELKTQNSGVFVLAETISYASSSDTNPRAGDVSYYGKLVEIVELNYYDSFRVILFKCIWADTRDGKGYKKDDFGHEVVNLCRPIHSGDGEEDEPYMLASQARLVYYVEDPQEEGWSVVVRVQPRDFYDMGDQDVSSDNPQNIINEDSDIQSSMLISDNPPNITLVRQVEDRDNSYTLNDLDDTMEVLCLCSLVFNVGLSVVWF